MRKFFACACLFLISSVPISAQRGGGRTVKPPSTSRLPNPELTANPGIFLSGKVVIDDGSALTETATIQTICRGKKNSETHTDSHGNFSFQFGERADPAGSGDFDADSSVRSSGTLRPERRNLQDCDLQASLAGFTSDVISLAGKFVGDQNADIGRIVLHRLATVQGFTVSATTVEAPADARKAFAKGREQASNSKWDDAEKSFQKAVSLFPRFAVAWFELGQAQLHKNDPVSARRAFHQSIAADEKYVNPYHSLAQMAMQDKNWHELIEFSEKLLALDPVSFPDMWLSNSVAHYVQKNWAAAEKSARRGLDVDNEHRAPKLNYMLALILVQMQDYQEAAQRMQAFLSQATKPEDRAEAERVLAEIVRHTAASVPQKSD